MTATVTTAFWSMTINNYDETSLALVRNGYPDYCREIIHTLEEGKEGTPHIQAWIKLQRQQRLSFVKKLFPRGHFKPLTSAEYVHNTKLYAQKNDETTKSAHVHVFHDPTGTLESLMKQVMLNIYKDLQYETYSRGLLLEFRSRVEKRMVEEDYKNAKIFVSASYKSMWKEFGEAMYSCVVEKHTHTHTHTDEKFSQSIDIPTYDGGSDTEGGSSRGDHEGDTEDEDYEDDRSEASEGSDEGGSSFSGSSYASEEHGEQGSWLEG